MKKITLLVLLAQLCWNCYGQYDRISIKFCPLAAIDVVGFPTIQAGVEIKFSDRITWYNELGIKYASSYINQTDTSFINASGFKIKSEVRYYFQRRHKTTFNGFYLAANAFFTQDHHNTQISYYHLSDTTTQTDVFGVKKIVFGGNALFGYQQTVYKRFMIDVYAGLGLRYRHINTINKQYDKNADAIISGIDFNVPYYVRSIDADGGSSFVPSITAGFRICYAF